MKKIFVFLICFFIPSFVFAGTCTLDEYVAGDETFKQNCTTLNVNTTTNLGNFGGEAVTFEQVEINSLVIDDMTFLSNVTTDTFIVRNSKVDLENLGIKAKVVYFRSSYIVNDDLSSLANNTIMETLKLDLCWLMSIETIRELSDISTFTDLYIYTNQNLHLNLEPIKSLNNLEYVDLSYMQHLVDGGLEEHISEMGIDSDDIVEDEDLLDELRSNLEDTKEDLENFRELDDYEQVRQITLYMLDRFSVNDALVNTPPSLAPSLKLNEAGITEYGIIFNYLLQCFDFKTANLLGHKTGASANSYAYTIIYLDNKWYTIDIYGLAKNEEARNAVRNSQQTDLYLQEADVTFSTVAEADQSFLEYMDYSFYFGYYKPNGLEVEVLPLDLTTYSYDNGFVEGYSFYGWYLDPSLTIPLDVDSAINKHTVLYGNYESVLIPPESGDDDEVTPPNTGMFMGVWIVLPIAALFGIEWFRNKRFNKFGGI